MSENWANPAAVRAALVLVPVPGVSSSFCAQPNAANNGIADSKTHIHCARNFLLLSMEANIARRLKRVTLFDSLVINP